MDSILRTKQVIEKPVEKEEKAKPVTETEIEDHIEVPYTEADTFLEDYFGLGTQWKDADAIFAEDLSKINEYISDLIEQGEIANSQSAVKEVLKRMEKINNLTKEERAVVKLEVLGNYAEFLMKNSNLKSKLRRYGN